MILKNKKIIFIILIAVFCIFLLNTISFADSFSLDKNSIDVSLNGRAYISTSGGSGTTTWSSKDPSIATVDNSGYVTGLKIGTTTITATRGTESASCTVNVVYYDISIGGNQANSITKVNLFLDVHESETLTATVKDAQSTEIPEAIVNWSSSDPSIVTVEESTR